MATMIAKLDASPQDNVGPDEAGIRACTNDNPSEVITPALQVSLFDWKTGRVKPMLFLG